GAEDTPALGRRAVDLVQHPELVLAEREHRLYGLELVPSGAQLVLEALGLLLQTGPLVLQRLVDAGREVGDLLLDRALLVGLALLQISVDLLAVLGHDLAQACRGILAALVAGG